MTPTAGSGSSRRDSGEVSDDMATGKRAGPAYGFPAPLWKALERHRPPGIGASSRWWRSPLRGPWLTSVFALVLLCALPIVTLTGLLSWVAYGSQPIPGDVGHLHLPFFSWPTSPAWLYRLNQGIHVILGLTLIPVVLAKLWSVAPKLVAWPPARSIAQVLERLSLFALVGGILFEIVTGVANIQYDYLFGFSFYTAHYYGAWVFIAGFVVHVAIKLPRMVTSLRSRSLRKELRTPLSATLPEPSDPDDLVAINPAEPTMSRRGALALVGGGSLLVVAVTAGQTIGGLTRRTALLLPRGRTYGDGPNDFQINRTAAAAGIKPADAGAGWRLMVSGASAPMSFSRSELLAMPQHTAVLPIACVEGWSTTQSWTGVRLRDLAALTGITTPDTADVQSLQPAGSFKRAILLSNQVLDPDSLLALRVNGSDLSLDHGYPARVVVPALPGVHNTKWVKSITFAGPPNA